MPPRLNRRQLDAVAIDEMMVEWHENWKDVLNEPCNRFHFAARQGSLKWLDMSEPKWEVRPGDRGTILESFEDDAVHFMAFSVADNGHLYVFDPAGPGSSYYDRNLKIRCRQKVLVPVIITPMSPQRHGSDNFCQTWSLAWLMGGRYEEILHELDSTMSGLRPNSLDSGHVEFGAMADLCKMFMSDFNHVPVNDAQWQACRGQANTVLPNFEKFLYTAPSYVADADVVVALNMDV